jgi:hypothetical protein
MPTESESDDFSRQAEEPQPGLLREFWDFLRTEKRWWLTPIIIVLLLFGVLLVLSATPLAPLIYTLF